MTTIGIILLLLVIIVFAAIMLTKCRKSGGCGCGRGEHGGRDGNHTAPTSGGPIDPVCGMTIDPDGNLTGEYQGKRYVFCSEHCKKSFEADPAKYVK